jgi:hypothetical protein
MPEALPSLAGVLAEHGWSLADGALARGWRETAVLERDLRALGRTQAIRANTGAAEKLTALIDQCLLVGQSLKLAADQRGLSLQGAIGDEAKYDAQHHAAIGVEPLRGAPVKIVAPAVVAGLGGAVIVKADVALKRGAAKPGKAPTRRKRG